MSCRPLNKLAPRTAHRPACHTLLYTRVPYTVDGAASVHRGEAENRRYAPRQRYHVRWSTQGAGRRRAVFFYVPPLYGKPRRKPPDDLGS